ncbi:MAG: undecaprenyl-phosphate 4-deoxy-4-formamido-L-arabinose transferase [Sodalis sp. Psp]|nr:undecaprenyl-phosphate 4-deoxy-4-formamido-L-arabinose transferase [Sodalis sp. Psp]MCR3756917.1 undecaprenyl-phosphate 4-deoxy-4-formamido-L-arabinose transferase [Sodalis sp. Ppy]
MLLCAAIFSCHAIKNMICALELRAHLFTSAFPFYSIMTMLISLLQRYVLPQWFDMMTPMEISKVSIVIPVYNEQESLPDLMSRTVAACKQLSIDYEILLVDDGSSDNSTTLLTAAAKALDSRIVAVLLNRNYGQHSAIMAGFNHVTGDLVVTLDADLQNPPEEIPRLVAVAAQGYDVVGTVRQNRQDSWFRKRASRMMNLLIQRTTGKEMGDYGCMLRAYRRHIIDAILHCHERSTFIPILANTFASKTIEIPVMHAEREFGDSKYSLMKLINLMYDLVTCLTTTPLRMLSVIGSIITLLGFAFSLLLIILRLFLGPHWAAEGVVMLFSVLFIFIGAQFISMGLLGEYIGRIYNDVRARPRYFVQRVVSQHSLSSQQETQ